MVLGEERMKRVKFVKIILGLLVERRGRRGGPTRWESEEGTDDVSTKEGFEDSGTERPSFPVIPGRTRLQTRAQGY